MPKDGVLINYDRHKVFEKLAVWPEQIIDYKGLSGDTSDNIPGVKGIGPKTASQLLASYGTIDGIYAHLDEIKSASVRQKLIDGRQNALDSQRLATIKLDVPMEFDFAHCHLTMPNLYNVKDYFTRLNFKQLTARLPRVLARFSPDGIAPDLASIEVAAESAVAATASALKNTAQNVAETFSKGVGTASNAAIAAAAARLTAAASTTGQCDRRRRAIFAGSVMGDLAVAGRSQSQ